MRIPGDISISFISCAGRQKCIPTTRSGRFEPAAISVMERVEVLEANIASDPQTLSRRPNSSRLMARSSKNGFDNQIALGQILNPCGLAHG